MTEARVERIDASSSQTPSLLETVKGLLGHAQADAPSSVMTVTLSTGERIECDLVIVSAGVRPNIGFLDGSGIAVGLGVLTDRHMQS